MIYRRISKLFYVTKHRKFSSLLQEKIAAYLENPENVPLTWRDFLEWNPRLFPEPVRSNMEQKLKQRLEEKQKHYTDNREERFSEVCVYDHMQMYRVMRNYQRRGHLAASIDPLNTKRPQFVHNNNQCPYTDYDSLNEIPLNKERKIILPDNSFLGGKTTFLTIKDIVSSLNKVYCKSIGIEFMTNASPEIRTWIIRKFEDPSLLQEMESPPLKQNILTRLIRAHCFEEFVNEKWPAERQHGATGCEILIPALQTLIDFGTSQGAQSFVLGMTTIRARLNVLANVFKKPLQQIFVPFHQTGTEGPELHDDDKYVLGNNVKKVTSGKALPTEFAVLASTANFVEAIDPLVSGKTRAEQMYTADDQGKRVWPIVIHGDEVMSGQGVVAENFRNSSRDSYSTKGTIHIVLTNQENIPSSAEDKGPIGIYCTNVAHIIMAPVFHVNSLDPEAVIYCMKVAAQYRAKFKSDVVVDIICYQKYHPSSKQIPNNLREKIDQEPPLLEKYAKKLVNEGLSSWYEIDHTVEKYKSLLEYSYSKAQKSSFKIAEWLDSPWKRFFEKKLQLVEPNTSVIPSVYKSTLENFFNYHADINIHPTILERMTQNIKLAKENKINWVMAENLAIAFMLQEGINVRLTGDTSEEGHYMQRHHLYHAIDSSKTRIPLRALYKAQGYYTVSDSLSCEFANLGFEIGFSQTSPKSLVIWEGGEEDRTSAAQYMIDVFLAAGEGRWFRQTGIVCLIPHGMEGKGEGASTGRPERFLQMCNDDYRNPITSMPLQLVKCNWIVANVTTPANYFHILRRQMKVNFRKPLILFTHKRLYLNTEIYSHREEFLNKKKFKVYFGDKSFEDEKSQMKEGVKKVLLCTGRVFYDLIDARKAAGLMDEIAICRIEQISPFPYEMISEDLAGYKNASFHWVQEEHRNQGWWSYVRHRLAYVMNMTKIGKERGVNYIGREVSPITAVSNHLIHLKEKKIFLEEAVKI